MNTNVQKLFDSLNQNQSKVIYSSAKQLLCLAGAGTGKTHTLVSKILYLTEILKLHPSNILALTFTNSAGKEMEARYVLYASNPDSRPFFGTFHSFCYNILCSDISICKKLGYSNVPQIINEVTEKTYITKAQMLSGVTLPAKCCSITYTPSNRDKFKYTVFQNALNKLLIQDNKITFDRLCYNVSQLFIDKDPLVIKYFQKYTFICVDEFQDTDPIQWKFVQTFLKRSSILLCGDIRQALYSFRGADSSILKSIVKDKSWEIIKLENNYRSTIEICRYANNWVKHYNDDIPDIELKSIKHGPDVQFIKISQFNEILSNINFADFKSSAIICRTNQEVYKLCKQLDSCNISYYTKSKSQFNNLIAAALDESFKREYLINKLPEIEKASLLRKLYMDSNYDPLIELSQKYPDTIRQIYELQDSDNFGQLRMLFELKELTFDDLDYSNNLDRSLYVGTIHSVKGLEFDCVYVYGVNSTTFKIQSNEDMMNLYYVACTRAKTSLIVIEA